MQRLGNASMANILPSLGQSRRHHRFNPRHFALGHLHQNLALPNQLTLSSAETSNLVEFLKDHEFFESLIKREAEWKLKSPKIMFDAVKEIENIFKVDS